MRKRFYHYIIHILPLDKQNGIVLKLARRARPRKQSLLIDDMVSRARKVNARNVKRLLLSAKICYKHSSPLAVRRGKRVKAVVVAHTLDLRAELIQLVERHKRVIAVYRLVPA